MSATPPDPLPPIAYLGPEGSFAHLVAKQRYEGRALRPFKTIPEVFEYVSGEPQSLGIVPIENSSGGNILPTVDGLIENACRIFVNEELSLDVKLALLGRKDSPIDVVYSHSAPLQHCQKWLRKTYPNAEHVAAPSTSGAVQFALQEPNAAAIGPIENAEMYGLEVLHYPIEKEVPNVTQFFVIAHERQAITDGVKSSFVVALPNSPGSLCAFLEPFKNAAVNLTRIQSRPIIGQPNTYMFLVELEGSEEAGPVQQALRGAGEVAMRIDSLGSYRVIARYQS